MIFNAEQESFRRTVRRFVQEEINPHVDEWEEQETFPAHELFAKMGELGLLGITYPEEVGGLGLDYWYQTVFLEEVGRAECRGIPMAIGVQTDMATPALAEFGNAEQHQKFLKPAIEGKAVFSIAISEPDAGSDVAAIKTRARRDGDHYVVDGSKMWITNGTQADYLTLLARTDDAQSGYRGMSLLVVPTDTPGCSVAKKLKKMGNHSSDTAIISLENVRVPVANRIGPEGEGFILQMKQFQIERICAAIMCVSGAEQAIGATVQYCRDRKVFGKKLISNQWIQFKLAELLAEVEALRHLTYHCVRKVVAKEDVTREASMAKLKAGRLIREVADTCVQFHGGMGYAEEYPMARFYRDARLLSIGGGADEVMLGIIAKMDGLA